MVRGRRLMDSWVFQEKGRRFEVTVSGTLTTTSGEVMHDWVRSGRGIALKAGWDLLPEMARSSNPSNRFGAIRLTFSLFVSIEHASPIAFVHF
jgi:DNA-binding transcriptional LysR family regulator